MRKKKLKRSGRARVPAHRNVKRKGSGLPPWYFLVIIAAAAIVLFYLVFWNLTHPSLPEPEEQEQQEQQQ